MNAPKPGTCLGSLICALSANIHTPASSPNLYYSKRAKITQLRKTPHPLSAIGAWHFMRQGFKRW
jgi:hypothetical protein